MKFQRYFTKNATPITWAKRDVKIVDGKGKIVFEMKDVEAPDTWSDNAVTITSSKYFKINSGVQETSVKQLVSRVVNKIVEWGDKDKYFSDEESKNVFHDELEHLIVNQMACPNSPILFNFGVEGRDQQAAACFLTGVEDSLDSIMDWMSIESRIFKNGSGSGTNISSLRPKGAPLSTGGYSSGPLSFLKAADVSAGVIKSGGANRRAATLRCMNIDHPDIEDFISCKVHEERKAKALIAAGYSDAIDGDAYSTVAFQNMNHSVRVSDSFMQRVKEHELEATRLMKLISESVWECGDPGILYDDTTNKYHTIPKSGRCNTTNPCAEYTSTDYSSCLLTSINLLKFYDNKKGFDYTSFKQAIDIIITALDIIIDNAYYPHDRFKQTAHLQRQLGLGYSNLGALLMMMGVSYGSEKGRTMAAAITSILTAEAYLQSSRIAECFDSFEDFSKNKNEMLHVIFMQLEEHRKRLPSFKEGEDLWVEVLRRGEGYGYRNATVTLLAPAGTISFVMDCDTTGIEPELGLIKYKKLVGGGELALPCNVVEPCLQQLGYSDSNIENILKWIKDNNTVDGCNHIKSEDVPIFDCAFKSPATDRVLSYMDHIEMVASVQPFLSMAISKTVNVPNEITSDEIIDIYIKAWKLGLKSISIYRDGCKATQPLNLSKVEDKPAQVKSKRKKLPTDRPSITHRFSVGGIDGYLVVGMYENGSPGELFITCSKLGSTLSGLLDSFATAISFALQYGAPLEFLVNKFKDSSFEPAGFTGNSDIPSCKSLIDYIFRWMNNKFLVNANKQFATTNGNGYNHNGQVDNLVKSDRMGTSIEQNDVSLQPLIKANIFYNGQVCSICGGLTTPTGNCMTCFNCGTTIGSCG